MLIHYVYVNLCKRQWNENLPVWNSMPISENSTSCLGTTFYQMARQTEIVYNKHPHTDLTMTPLKGSVLFFVHIPASSEPVVVIFVPLKLKREDTKVCVCVCVFCKTLLANPGYQGSIAIKNCLYFILFRHQSLDLLRWCYCYQKCLNSQNPSLGRQGWTCPGGDGRESPPWPWRASSGGDWSLDLLPGVYTCPGGDVSSANRSQKAQMCH